MKHRLPPLSALRAFEAASRLEKFSDAADDLCVSHSAISQQIRSLEDWLQVKLFVRLGNRVTLTEEGRALRPRINEAFEIMAEACAFTSRYTEAKSVSVIAEPAFATRWLRPRLVEFRSLNPEISIYLDAGWEQDSSYASSADIVIHFENRFTESKRNIDRLFPIDGYPACSPGFLQDNPGIAEPADICRFALIHDNSKIIWKRWFNEFVPGSDAWEKGYVYSDLSLAIDAALDGEGLFLADDILCSHEISSGTLVKALPETLRCAWYCSAIKSERVDDPGIRSFVEWMLDSINEGK